jgi:predicted RNA-binding protein YlxR (DUF448 family)
MLTRTCTGCGRKAPKDELVRFVASEGTLARDPSGQALGRGAYTCASSACFERSVARRGFARTLRSNVSIPAGLNPFSEED